MICDLKCVDSAFGEFDSFLHPAHITSLQNPQEAKNGGNRHSMLTRRRTRGFQLALDKSLKFGESVARRTGRKMDGTSNEETANEGISDKDASREISSSSVLTESALLDKKLPLSAVSPTSAKLNSSLSVRQTSRNHRSSFNHLSELPISTRSFFSVSGNLNHTADTDIPVVNASQETSPRRHITSVHAESVQVVEEMPPAMTELSSSMTVRQSCKKRKSLFNNASELPQFTHSNLSVTEPSALLYHSESLNLHSHQIEQNVQLLKERVVANPPELALLSGVEQRLQKRSVKLQHTGHGRTGFDRAKSSNDNTHTHAVARSSRDAIACDNNRW